MASELGDLIAGAADAKALLFSTDDFAGGYGRSVTGRVKRRRAVTATAMGGASVIAVGAVAVGASQVPWGNFVMGASPGSSPSVVCTTSTPDAVALTTLGVPPGASRVLVDLATDSPFFIGPVDGVARAWQTDGSPVDLVPAGDHAWDITLPSGELVKLETGPNGSEFLIVATHGAAISVLTIDEFMRQADTSSQSVHGEDGTFLGRAVQIADGHFVLFADDKAIQLTDTGADRYSYVDGSGQTVRVTLVDDNPSGVKPKPTATPVVTCVTTTPEPTGSPSPDPSGPATTSPSASPSASSDVALAVSPFQCGSDLASDEYGTAQLSIGSVEWLTAEEVNAQLDMSYMGGKAPYGATGSGPVARVIVSDTRPLRSGEEVGLTSSDSTDPVESVNSVNLGEAQGLAAAVLGTSFVAVRDGVVVATVPGNLGDQDHAISLEPNATDLGVTATFLNPDGAFAACSGGTLGNGWDLYAVAGQLFVYPDGSVEKAIYAWHKIDPAG